MKLYQDILMDHYRYPRNRRVLQYPDFLSGQFNPSCGDSVAMQGCVCGSTVTTIAFSGKGCVISQAAASMLTEKCSNKHLDEILTLDKKFVLQLIGLELGPTRLKCALLPLEALQQGIRDYQKKKTDASSFAKASAD